jgi:lipopolysaccharide transport system permease protein
MFVILARGAWAYRGFILASMRREFESKYRNSLLGAAWTVIQPLSMVAIYAVVFSQVMQARLPGSNSPFAYAIYLCSGILTWGYFAEIVTRGQTIFVDNANLIKKLNFPKICLPIIAVLNASLNFAIIFAIFTAFLLITGNFPGLPFLAIFPVLAIQAAFAIGLGVTLGVLNVFFRDVGHFFAIFLQFWFWFTPIVYPLHILPEWMQSLIWLNPMTGLVGAYHDILVAGTWPRWADLLPVTVLGALLCIFAMRLFAKRSGEMVDEL